MQVVRVTGGNADGDGEVDRWMADLSHPFPPSSVLFSIFDDLPDMVVVKDAEHLRFVYLNRRAEQLLGCQRGEWLGKSDRDLFAPEQADFLVARDREVLAAGLVVEIPSESIDTPKGTRTLRTRMVPVLDDVGGLRYLVGISEDITERHAADLSLSREHASRLTRLNKVVRDKAAIELLAAVAVAASNGDSFDEALQVCLDQACAHLGWPVGHAYVLAEDGPMVMLSSSVWHVDDPVAYSALQTQSALLQFGRGMGLIGRVMADAKAEAAHLSDADWLVDHKALRAAGLVDVLAFPVIVGQKVAAVLEFYSSGPAELDDHLTALMGNVSAQLARVVERERSEERLTYQALHDDLTGLPNRVLFTDRLTQALARLHRQAQHVAVLFIDLDNFKVVNDSLGHDQGDLLLYMIAERLQSATRPGDTVARFGGDEFVVLCEDVVGEIEALGIADRIQMLFTDPIAVDGRDHRVTVSTGIALSGSPNDLPADLIRDADAAMYQAKEAGRARTAVFSESMRTRAVRRLETELALRRALDNNELTVFYQPIVDLATGKTHSVEALVRWSHPTEGLVFPDEFIGIAEQTGLIIPLGEWVLEQACRQTQSWRQNHEALSDLCLSVNLSAGQIAQPDLVEVVANILAVTHLPAACLTLEITESVLMRDADQAMAVLHALKRLGVKLSIDDFGTGYSSLTYLKRFPVETLKIDRSFVSELGPRGERSAIVEATIQLARSLGLETVAEGTETAAQLEALRTLGCSKAQGYFLSRPHPPEVLTPRLLAPLLSDPRPPVTDAPAPAERRPAER